MKLSDIFRLLWFTVNVTLFVLFVKMQGTIIENLSGKKLSVLVVLLIIGQIICFLIGGLIGKFIYLFTYLFNSNN